MTTVTVQKNGTVDITGLPIRKTLKRSGPAQDGPNVTIATTGGTLESAAEFAGESIKVSVNCFVPASPKVLALIAAQNQPVVA